MGASRLAPVAILVTVVLWASAFVAIRHVGQEISAGPLALGRLLVGSVVLGVVLLLQRRRSADAATRPHAATMPAGPAELAELAELAEPADSAGPAAPSDWRRRDIWARLILVGVLWFGIYNVALNAAERRVDAGTAAMLVNIGPILITILAGLVLREGFPRRVIVGSLVAFAGVVVIGLSTSRGSAADTWGVLLCLLAAILYAISVVVQKPLLGRLSGLRVTWAACTIGAIVCLPFSMSLVREARAADWTSLAWLVYLGAMPTALAFTTWAYALARTTAGKLGATTYLVPPIAILLGWALLGEAPAGLAYVGGVMCLLGVYVTRRQPSSTVDPASLPQDRQGAG